MKKDATAMELKARMFDIQVEQEQLQLKINALIQEKTRILIKISDV